MIVIKWIGKNNDTEEEVITAIILNVRMPVLRLE